MTYSKCSKISNTSCLLKRPSRQTAQTQIRLLLKKQSDQDLPCLLFWQVFCEFQPWTSTFYLRTEWEKCSKFLNIYRTFCCCFWCMIKCSHWGISWEVFRITCTALFNEDCRSSRLGFITTLGICRTMSARNSGGFVSSSNLSFVYLLDVCRRRFMASSDRRVPWRERNILAHRLR